MKGSAPRYTTPLDTPRPPGARMLEAFSPKISRRVRLFDRASFNLWISLEADTAALGFCERPARLGTDPRAASSISGSSSQIGRNCWFSSATPRQRPYLIA